MFNCETFTASVSSVPAATPVILLPAASIPDLVTLGPPAIVKPSLLMVVSPAFKPSFVKATLSPTFTPSLFITVSPAFTLSTFMSFANLISNLSLPSATTPMLPSESLVASVSPPTTLTVSPNLRVTLVPVSPAKVNGILRTLLIASATSPAVARLFGFAAVALPVCASVVIFVVFTSNFTIVPLSASVTFTVVKLPSLKFTKPLLLIRDLEVPFCCTLKPL